MENVAKAMSIMPLAHMDFDEWHNVFPGTGLYVRYANYKAGEMILGKEHADYDLTILSKGSLILMSDIKGEQVKVVAPYIFETPPGAQKIGKILTDVTVMNVMRAHEGETAEDVHNRSINKKEIKLCLQDG